MRAPFEVVNHSVARVDGRAKVTGKALYTGDLTLPRMCHAKVVRSTRAHALLLSIDAAEALAIPGVVAVLTGDDLAGLNRQRYGHAIADHPVVALEKVRYVGEPVAVVIAEDERTAQEAARLVRIEYQPLPAAMNVEEAIAEDAALIHSEPYSEGAFSGVTDQQVLAEERGLRNVAHRTTLGWGDPDAALASASHVVEETYDFPLGYAYAMEPYVAIADHRGDDLTVYSSAQHPYMVRHDLAQVFGLPLNAVRMIVGYVGGGFGSKSYTKIEPLTAACSWKVRRPVKLALSVEEAILTTRIAGARMRVRTGADAAGNIVARVATLYFDGGAYAENSPHGAHLSPRHIIAPYRIPNVRVDSYLVYTNTAPASSFRGFSSTQVTFAGESQMDELASLAGVDRIRFRERNLAGKGERPIPTLRELDCEMAGDLELAAEAIDWTATREHGVGHGVALMVLGAGAHPVSTSEVRVHADGSVTVMTGTTEMGQGSETVLAQIAAEELQVPLEMVRVQRTDTAMTPFERSTGASRSTTLQGRALINACADARDRVRRMAADAFKTSPDAVVDARGGVNVAGRRLAYGDVLRAYFGMEDCEAVGIGHVRRAGDLEKLPVFWEASVVGVKVRVDAETGRVALERLVTVADVGLAINPALVEGQDLGAAIQGMGAALFEELRYAGEELANGSLLQYRVPRFSDVPRELESILVERQDGVGPYGAKGGGEGAIAPMAPAIAGAIADATGRRIRSLPMTPERVWRALKDNPD